LLLIKRHFYPNAPHELSPLFAGTGRIYLGDHALGGTIDGPDYQLTIGRECCGMVQLLLERHAKKAVVAVARPLAIDLWPVRTGRLSAEQFGLSIQW
jgi:hypothetical protein